MQSLFCWKDSYIKQLQILINIFAQKKIFLAIANYIRFRLILKRNDTSYYFRLKII